MRALILGLFLIGLTNLCFAQVDQREELSEVEIYAKNSNYLIDVKSDDILPAITTLQRKVANFDIKSLYPYDDNYMNYKVVFFIPEGEITAIYDDKSNVLFTIEKFENIKLPRSVVRTILSEYPDSSIINDTYMINYDYLKGAKRWYKIVIEKNDEKIKVSTDENGNIL